jgi:hypothetical protein
MFKFITGTLLGILLSVISLCILYRSKISWDWGFGFSDILGVVSAIIIWFYMPRKLSQALNNKKDKKQYLLDAINEIERQITLFVETVESYCCSQSGVAIDKETAVNILFHKMEMLWNQLNRTKETNKIVETLKQDRFEGLYLNFLHFKSVLDDTRNSDFSFNYSYLRTVSTEAEIKLLGNLQQIKWELLNRI